MKFFYGILVFTIATLTNCKSRSAQNSLEDVSDGNYRFGLSQYVDGQRFVAFSWIVCAENDAISREKCFNPLDMLDSAPSKNSWVPSYFVNIPKNKQKIIFDRYYATQIAAEETAYRNLNNKTGETLSELNKTTKIKELGQKILVDSQGRVSVLQNELKQIFSRIEMEKLEIPNELFLPQTPIPPSQFALVVRSNTTSRNGYTLQAAGGVSSHRCQCLNTPAEFTLPQANDCNRMIEDPAVCRIDNTKALLPGGKRCFCIHRSGARGRELSSQRYFDPGPGVKCEQVKTDPVDACFDEKDAPIYKAEQERISIINRIRRIQNDLDALEKTSTPARASVQSAIAREQTLMLDLTSLQTKLDQLEQNLQRHKAQPLIEKNKLIVANFSQTLIELEESYNKIMSGEWQETPQKVVRSVPDLLLALVDTYEGKLRLSCRALTVMPEFRDLRKQDECLPLKEKSWVLAAPKNTVSEALLYGVYEHSSLGRVQLEPTFVNGEVGSLHIVSLAGSNTAGAEPQNLDLKFDECNQGFCTSKNISALAIAILGKRRFALVQTYGQQLEFNFVAAVPKLGVYEDIRKTQFEAMSAIQRADSIKQKGPLAHRATISRPTGYPWNQVNLCIPSLDKKVMIRENYTCDQTGLCIASKNKDQSLSMISSIEMELKLQRTIQMAYLGETSLVQQDCVEANLPAGGGAAK